MKKSKYPIYHQILSINKEGNHEYIRTGATLNDTAYISLPVILAMYGTSDTYGAFNSHNNFQTPDGTDNTVWSFFWYYDTTAYVPQFNPQTKKWEMMHPVNRKFTIDMSKPSTSESNMFAMPGIIFDTTETGIILSKVYGPLNESAIPLRKAVPVKNGQTAITAAKKGAPYPVGQPIPNKN